MLPLPQLQAVIGDINDEAMAAINSLAS